jgi:hypothetical protein
MNPQPVSAAEATRWLSDLTNKRPPMITRAEGTIAVPVPSFIMQGADDGVFVRLQNRDGTHIDVFLNAVVAAAMIGEMIEFGKRAEWRNEDDGSVIVHDPQNLPDGVPKSRP